MDLRATLSCLLLPLLLACLIGSPRSSPSPTSRTAKKARYEERGLRRYPARTYAHVAASIRGAVAIAMKDRAKPFASGVLIAQDMVLTARHATLKHAAVRGAPEPPRFGPTELEVRFDYIEQADGTIATPQVFPVVAYLEGASGHDWILLKLGSNKRGALPDASRVRALSDARPALDDPIYVVGFPKGGPMEVADEARVHFPFETTRAGLEQILARANPADAAQIRRSYRRQADGRRHNYSVVFGGQPTIGVDSDTVAGMSGAGVYLKRTGQLIGILVDGQPDTGRAGSVSWWRHEAVLPVTSRLVGQAKHAGAER